MNWADYCILGTLAISVLMGLWRGFVAEVMALSCWALAFWVAYTFGADLAEKFSSSIRLVSARFLLGYAICFITVLIAGSIVTFLIRKLVSSSGLSGTDRMLGMLFGLARGGVVVTLMVLLLGFTPFPKDLWWHESQLLPTFQTSAEWLSAQLPAEVAKYLDWRALIAGPVIPEKPAATQPASTGVDKDHPPQGKL